MEVNPMEPILKLSNVSYSYHTPDGETKALADISFTLMPGEFTAVVGPSGCGKSTLLSLIAGLMQPEAGNMSLGGMPLTENSSKIGYMLQHDHLFEWRTVYRNVILGAEIRGKVTPQIRARAEQLLEQYGLERFARSRPSELSGGMRQRAALIRTLLLDPELLLLDEPFSALDYQTRLTVSDDIGQIISAGVTSKTVVAEHHVGEVTRSTESGSFEKFDEGCHVYIYIGGTYTKFGEAFHGSV